jgi:hypothetical protein
LLDHEMSHVAVAEDANGEQREDENGLKLWRTVKHDIEEFTGVVKRHGTYKRDLEVFAAALLEKSLAPLLPIPDPDQPAQRAAPEVTQ